MLAVWLCRSAWYPGSNSTCTSCVSPGCSSSARCDAEKGGGAFSVICSGKDATLVSASGATCSVAARGAVPAATVPGWKLYTKCSSGGSAVTSGCMKLPFAFTVKTVCAMRSWFTFAEHSSTSLSAPGRALRAWNVNSTAVRGCSVAADGVTEKVGFRAAAALPREARGGPCAAAPPLRAARLASRSASRSVALTQVSVWARRPLFSSRNCRDCSVLVQTSWKSTVLMSASQCMVVPTPMAFRGTTTGSPSVTRMCSWSRCGVVSSSSADTSTVVDSPGSSTPSLTSTLNLDRAPFTKSLKGAGMVLTLRSSRGRVEGVRHGTLPQSRPPGALVSRAGPDPTAPSSTSSGGAFKPEMRTCRGTEMGPSCMALKDTSTSVLPPAGTVPLAGVPRYAPTNAWCSSCGSTEYRAGCSPLFSSVSVRV